ncbi:proton-coupled amino acid transporter-like protein CG1139 isoform X2 [Anthonomus grandis grandis]|uniref:proton-coupled amino acid transporter-like protein CG1139 isoform X2 n=1 Tax=Anthonomus grandis grandis TaxID=2921223 RepID=UPI0021658995|nr:proton-coupled amino acid transporter-like protein CG1139 isoform X2 [Anthonomus grandis grandis]
MFIEKNTSLIRRSVLGTGVLAMPEAFKYAGMYNGIIFLLTLAVFVTYCLHILVRTQYILCKKKQTGLLYYADSMIVACEVGPGCFKNLGSILSFMTDFFMIFYQIGTCCVYWVFVGDNLKYVVDNYYKNNFSKQIYMLFLFVPHCLGMCIRNLKLLAPFSLVADVITFVTFAVVYYYIFSDLQSNFTDRPAWGSAIDFPLFFGTVLFSLQSVPVVISVENNMKTPAFFRKWYGQLNVGFGLLTIFYFFVGVFGYWRYGEDIKSAITMNFPKEEILAQVIIISYCIAIFLSYLLNAYVPIHILEERYIYPKLNEDATERKKFWIDMALRFLYVCVTCLISTTIPLLGLIISLCGVFCTTHLGIIFPPLMEICALWEDERSKPKTLLFWKSVAIIIFGIFSMVIGVYATIKAMVEQLEVEYMQITVSAATSLATTISSNGTTTI